MPAQLWIPELVEVTVPSPWCAFAAHCGSRAIAGLPVRMYGCENTPVRCLECPAHGDISVRTEALDG